MTKISSLFNSKLMSTQFVLFSSILLDIGEDILEKHKASSYHFSLRWDLKKQRKIIVMYINASGFDIKAICCKAQNFQ